MAWKHTACPLFRAGSLNHAPWTELPEASCPPDVVRQLAANSLRADEQTVRDGNCGVHAFVTGLVDQMQCKAPKKGGPGAALRRKLLRAPNGTAGRIAMARAAGAAWLKDNAGTQMWEGMSVGRLCVVVSGMPLRDYIASMQQDGQWADTAFLHALGCAYVANVFVFQAGMDIALLGPSLCEETAGNKDPIAVPVALANNYHFWGVTQQAPTLTEPVDKGDFALAFLPDQGVGSQPSPKRRRVEEGLPGQGVGPQPQPPSKHHQVGEGQGTEEDGFDLTPYFQQEHGSGGAEESSLRERAVQVELDLCQALAHWCPWSEPSAELVSTMRLAAGCGLGAEGRDVGTACLARADAIRQLAYEEVHGSQLPEALKYQRAARCRLTNPGAWKRCVVTDQRLVTTSYLQACAGVPALEEMASRLANADCGQWGPVHEPGNRVCVGLQSFSASVVINWRILWWSLPKTSRKEHLLKAFRASLASHRAMGGTDERWRMQYQFLGHSVCRNAFMILSGASAFACQEARDAALQGKCCWVSRAELGLASSIRNASKAAAYLGARQWLEWYAATYAEMSPMSNLAYLPAGRKAFYYQHYRQDMLKRAALTSPSGVYAPGDNPDLQLADESTFLKAWRMEVPWLVVCKSVSMFTRCSVCEYLKLLKEQTPKEQEVLRAAIEARLGRHFEFQAAQRLAHARVEEECAQSGGHKWLMVIDKMDQTKTIVPTVWSQLPTTLFKDPDRRIIAGVIGSMWYGTMKTTHLLRTVFPDCSHGAEMQSSAILLNLHAVALEEGHLPNTFVIAADNTRKETKNQTTMWFLIWLLCALNNTALCQIQVIFLLVGHTHNQLDRFFSRLGAAIAGQDYFTVPGMLNMVMTHVKHCQIKPEHLAQVWGWKELLQHEAAHAMHNLDPVHAFRYTRSTAGIHMQWKQWCTDETWSKQILIVPACMMDTLGQFRPAKLTMEFPAQGQTILDWINKFELWCSSQPEGKYRNLDAEIAWLRQAVNHQAPGVYAPGAEVQGLLQALRQLPGKRPEETSSRPSFPDDIITQLFPSADIPPIPADSLVRVDNITHRPSGQAMRSNVIFPGSTLVVKVPASTIVHGSAVQFLCAVALETSRRQEEAEQIVVGWYLPSLARAENFRPSATETLEWVCQPQW